MGRPLPWPSPLSPLPLAGLSAADRYRQIRSATEQLSAPLSAEDCQAQSMDDASPTKWHLAHTSWFFETFVLDRWATEYEVYHPVFRQLFNSYYEAVGERHPRPQRGLLSRPTLAEVWRYRAHVDDAMERFLERPSAHASDWMGVVELGFHHEQQHQELILTDIKHLFSSNALHPAYLACPSAPPGDVHARRWHQYPEGMRWIGHDGNGFAFDNEAPHHRTWVGPFALASRLVTNEEYLAFVEDGGYRRPDVWLSDGWRTVQRHGWEAPLYWEEHDGRWFVMTLSGLRPLRLDEPVCHVSFYEADAFARWSGARLPTEAEWEVVAAAAPVAGNFVESGLLHPAPARHTETAGPLQLFGDVWEWTRSAYEPYPGFQPAGGALGEYNGKFMCNQIVLRGGSCATPTTHMRHTYRNFFPPDARWQFSGLRLARDAT